MPQPITLLTATLVLAVLYVRYKSRPKVPRSTHQRHLKIVKLLLAALAVWMAARYSLQHALAKMDGTDQEPSFIERAVTYLSK